MKEIVTIKFLEVKQLTNNTIGFATLRYSDIKDIVRFTERTLDEDDPFADEGEILKEKERKTRYYQRLRESNKVSSIKHYIIGELVKKFKYENQKSMLSPLGTFPTSILLAANLFEAESVEIFKESDVKGLCYLDNDHTLYVPKEESLLIVDGQHRIEGLNSLRHDIREKKIRYNKKPIQELYGNSIYDYFQERLDSFEFACMLLIDFDLYEQGEIFANTNFNQKPVNRSIYYDIFGTSPNTEKNSLKFAHDIVAHLNYSPKSPLHNRIKMLGAGEGLISQAALVELFMELFSPKKVWNVIYSDYLKDGQEYKFVTVFVRGYFDAFKTVFSAYWPTEQELTSRQYKNILCKTTGMGAIIKLIQYFYKYVKSFEKDFPDILKNENLIKEKVEEKLDTIKDMGGKYFSGEEGVGNYAKGGSKGLQSKLFYELSDDLGFIKNNITEKKAENNFK